VSNPDASLRSLLRRRLWMLLPLLLASAVASFGLASYFAGKVFDGWLGDSTVSLGRAIEESRQEGGPWLPKQAVDMVKWDSVDQLYVYLLPGDGSPAQGDAIAPPSGDGDSDFYDALYQGRHVRVAQAMQITAAGSAPSVIRVAETLRKRRNLRYHLLLASIPLQLSVLALAVLLLRSATSAGALAARQAAHRMAAYNATHPDEMPERFYGPSELQPAFDAMSALIARLARAQEVQQRFVSNAAHQLRTPLAVLQIQIESALREQDPERQREDVQQALAGLTRLRRLVEQLLTLNRSTSASDTSLGLAPLDLTALAREEVEFHSNRAIQERVDLGYDGPDDPIWIIGDVQLLREALANLIDNAFLYGGPAGVVTVGVRSSPLQLFVEDDGPGIAQVDRERVVERFYRATSRGDGSGLGLAIVAEIAARHDAQVLVEEAGSGGARIVLRFTGAALAAPGPQD